MSDPVTIVITRTVRAGSEEQFEAAVKAWSERRKDFPGHLGVLVLRPTQGSREYGAVLKFKSKEDWVAFQQWPEYQKFLAEIRPLLEGDSHIETTPGLEVWLAPLGAKVTAVPPRWKMACVTWIGVNVAVYAVAQLKKLMVDWNEIFVFLLGNALVVAALTWILMPVLGRLFKWWLHPAK